MAMKVTIAQLNYHIGNFESNKTLIIRAIENAKTEGSDLIIFSELSIPGYPPLDLLERVDFVEQCLETVNEIAAYCNGITAIVGSPTFNEKKEGKKLYNSALVLSEGRVIFKANKALLPTYDIFDEYRYFEPEKEFAVFDFNGLKIALTICEDLWDEQPFDNKFEKSRMYTISPMEELARFKPDLIINISASPFSYTKIEAKKNIFMSKAARYKIPVISVNQTGANTELIFDGASIIIDRNGNIIHQFEYFEEAVRSFPLEKMTSVTKTYQVSTPDTFSLIHKALITGIRDYFSKTGFKKAIIGLSGGIDSAVSLCLAAEALGYNNVKALLMPSRYSSEHSIADSVSLARRIKVKYEIISIEKPFSAFENILTPFFKGKRPDITEENLQARIRALILMSFSNKFSYILLNTSNKSEAAVGYGTLYGDMAGGLSVIGDVYKTDVYNLARYINRESEVIPENIIKKAPSAELKPEQYDTDSLPDYKLLDSILYQYIELQKPPDEINVESSDNSLVTRIIKMINYNEYKRYQSPPVLRISSKSFGDGRKLPIAAKY
jgi:NAD+ synthase (glutamine-hydrolysing)